MQRFDGPGWRFAGAFAGWLAFAFFFSCLYQVAAVVAGLGGYCASGGPYVIETECPDAVVVFAPISVFGGLLSVAVSAFLARGFGMSLTAWSWPILFIGLGIQFLLTALQGDVVGVVLCVLFVGMGGVPLVIGLRTAARSLFLGVRSLGGRPFAGVGEPRRTVAPFVTGDDRGPVAATAADWALSLGSTTVAVSLGVWLAISAFHAVGSASAAG